jgi:hypothetical protein
VENGEGNFCFSAFPEAGNKIISKVILLLEKQDINPCSPASSEAG